MKMRPSPDDGNGLERRQFSRWGPLTGTRPGGPRRHTATGPDGEAGGFAPPLRAASTCSPARGGRCRSETGAPSLRTIRPRGVRLRRAFSCLAGCAGGHAHGRFSRWGQPGCIARRTPRGFCHRLLTSPVAAEACRRLLEFGVVRPVGERGFENAERFFRPAVRGQRFGMEEVMHGLGGGEGQ